MKREGWRKALSIVAICAVVGALAGIAGTMAAPSKSSKSAATKKANAQKRAHRFGFRGAPGPGRAFFGGPGGPAVHSEMVVPNPDGTGFDTITMDNGKLKAIDGSKLTITEGTDKATYGEPTIDVGDSPTVIRNHEKAKLGDLKEGDFVHVVRGTPKGTLVLAEDAAFRAQERKEHHRFGPPGPPRGEWPAPPPPAENGSDESGTTDNGSNS